MIVRREDQARSFHVRLDRAPVVERHQIRVVLHTAMPSRLTPADALFGRRQDFDWLISTRWPSGSRRKQRISDPQSCGGVRKAAPRDRSAS